MQVVIDTVSIKHLLRKPKKIKSRRRQARHSYRTSLDKFLSNRALRVVLDKSNNVQSEWEKTCGIENIRVLITHWGELGGIQLTDRIGNLPTAVSNELRRFGFVDTMDKFLLRLSLGTNTRSLISDDPDFWDPSNVASKGNANAVVAKLCKDRLDVTIMLLRQLIAKLN